MTRMLRSTNPTEYQIQCSIIEYANKWKAVNRGFPSSDNTVGDYLFHIPNGGLRNKVEAVKLKKMGVKAGVWDLFLMIPTFTVMHDHRSGLFIEVKSQEGKLTKNQKEFEAKNSTEYSFIVVNSLESFIAGVSTYLRVKDFNVFASEVHQKDKAII